MEIDARANTFQTFEVFGHQLLQNNHYASDDVKEKLKELADAREALEECVLSALLFSYKSEATRFATL